jgi:hypothetical protein
MLGAEMGIAERHLEVTVAQDLLEVLEGAASHDEVRGEGMPQVVKPELLDAGPIERALERVLTCPQRRPSFFLKSRPWRFAGSGSCAWSAASRSPLIGMPRGLPLLTLYKLMVAVEKLICGQASFRISSFRQPVFRATVTIVASRGSWSPRRRPTAG